MNLIEVILAQGSMFQAPRSAAREQPTCHRPLESDGLPELSPFRPTIDRDRGLP
ncbi:MAG: hypothetical protein ACREXI_14840 [Caldimonas sp.]